MRVCLSLFCPDEKLLVYPSGSRLGGPSVCPSPTGSMHGPAHTPTFVSLLGKELSVCALDS